MGWTAGLRKTVVERAGSDVQKQVLVASAGPATPVWDLSAAQPRLRPGLGATPPSGPGLRHHLRVCRGRRDPLRRPIPRGNQARATTRGTSRANNRNHRPTGDPKALKPARRALWKPGKPQRQPARTTRLDPRRCRPPQFVNSPAASSVTATPSPTSFPTPLIESMNTTSGPSPAQPSTATTPTPASP